MATLTYKLRKTKGDGATVQLFFNYGTEKRLRYSTGYRIQNQKNWDKKTMRIKNVREERLSHQTNNRLNLLQTTLEKGYFELNDKKTLIDNDILKQICDKVCNRNTSQIGQGTNHDRNSMDLFEFFEWYLEYHKNKPLPTTSRPMNKGTARTYRNTMRILKEFSSSVYKLNFDKITLEFYYDFLDYLYAKDYSANYVGTIIKILKTIMAMAFDQDLHNNMAYLKRSFKKPSEEVFNIFLTQKELENFAAVDTTKLGTLYTNTGHRINNEQVKIAQDLFMIACNTGLRVSNFNKLLSANIYHEDGRPYFKVIAKGNKEVAILDRAVKVSHLGRIKVSSVNQVLKIDSIAA